VRGWGSHLSAHAHAHAHACAHAYLGQCYQRVRIVSGAVYPTCTKIYCWCHTPVRMYATADWQRMGFMVVVLVVSSGSSSVSNSGGATARAREEDEGKKQGMHVPRSRRSRSNTCQPAAIRAVAADIPDIPAPTTTAVRAGGFLSIVLHTTVCSVYPCTRSGSRRWWVIYSQS
jgi:hypothetical protein